ncbi:MAG TPA: MFS transporter [Ktedonobacteraceae bacterium]|nr:MFS transporter [Ktedonobacteraceae bacterium]
MEQTRRNVSDLSQAEYDIREEQVISIPAAGRDLTLVSAAHAVIHAMSVLMPLIYPIIQVEYHLSYTQIGLIVAIPNAVGGLLQIIFGLLSRYILRKVMLGVGNILVGASTFFTGTITGFWTLMLWTMLSRIAGAPQHPVGSSYLSDRYGRKRHGYALAWHVAGGNIGTLAVPLIAGPLLGMWGWRPVLYVAALPGILIGIAILILVDEKDLLDRRVPRQKSEPGAGQSRQWSMRNVTTGIKMLFEPLRNRTLAVIMLVSIIAAGGRGLGNVTTYVPLYLQNIRHLNSTTISIFFTILLLGSVLGPLLGGRLSDWIGRRRMLFFFYGASAVTTILFIVVAGPDMPLWLIPLSLVLMGFAVYAESPLLQAYLADTSPSAIRDTSFGLYFALAFGIGSIWSGILGWIIDHYGFGAAFWTMAGSYVAAGLLLLLIRREAPAGDPGKE